MRHIDLDIDNRTLVEECRSGDRDAMSILYTRFAPRLLHVITRYVSDRDSAHDILHDGFIAALTRIDSLRNPDQVEFWLATIMKNLSLKYLQAQSVTSILDEIPENIDEPDLDDILDFATIESLIRQLPEGYQKVFRLAVLEGKTHKEISEILGIAPNSSSSQLFHAKIRMRELIREYKIRAGLISLLLLLACSGLLFLSRIADDFHTSDHKVSQSGPKTPESRSDRRQDPLSDETYEENSVSSGTPIQNHSAAVSTTPSGVFSADSENVSSETPAESESVSTVAEDSVAAPSSTGGQELQPSHPFDDGHDNVLDRLYAVQSHKVSKDNSWSAGILFDPGMLSFNGSANDYSTKEPSFNDPGPPQGSDDDKNPPQAKSPAISRDVASALSSAPRRHHLPISFALTAEKRFSSWLGVESGIGYSYLHTDFELHNALSTCHWNYLEIPVKVNLYAYTSPRFKVYGSFGGRVSVPVYSYAQISPNSTLRSGSFSSKPVWSAGASVGVALRLSKRVDLFVEPTLRYNFPQQCKIPNIWTDDEPWSVSLPIGFRFSW
ncbi:MAG: sigma-70 family RNA polymerase sigma factor [Muribaculaceae bacterium]|nr:sigma-70 family RNA polymerase sigma factor [Muribaculaceae bacterium]